MGRADAVLGVVLRQADQAVLTQQLQDALTSRSVIDQALGVLMGQQRCTAAEAFRLLRAASSRHNRKLRDVAADLIVNVSGHPPVPGHFNDGHPTTRLSPKPARTESQATGPRFATKSGHTR